MVDRTTPYDAVIAAPFTRLGIGLMEGALARIDFVSQRVPLRAPQTSLGREIREQLNAYFRDPRFRFTLPLVLTGSAYQQGVWRALRRIPAGVALSYGELAARMRTSARAVGGACRANPVPIVIPCHRVVAVNAIGGFMGQRSGPKLELKRWLLQHEHAG
jgi:methylated-DNA-[protein]-cysteine S-methyltransferase